MLNSRRPELKVGVGKSVPERVQDRFVFRIKGLKIPISHINIFPVFFRGRDRIEGVGAGIILIAGGNGIGQLSRRVYIAAEHIRESVAPFHARLPCDEQGRDVRVGVDERQIHDGGDVHNHDSFGKTGIKNLF